MADNFSAQLVGGTTLVFKAKDVSSVYLPYHILATSAGVEIPFPAALGQTVMANSFGVAIASNQSSLKVIGSVAHDSPDADFPVKVAGKGNSSAPTLTTAGDVTDIWTSLAGAVVVGGVTYTPADGVALSAATIVRASSTTAVPLAVIGMYYNGSNVDVVRGHKDYGAMTTPYAFPADSWSYAAAGSGIVNTTTAVTIKASAGGSLRNYITSIDISTDGALGTATEVAIRDGAGGTVLWRMKIGTAGLQSGRTIPLPRPLRGTAATLLELVTLSASGTGAVYFNATGFVAL